MIVSATVYIVTRPAQSTLGGLLCDMRRLSLSGQGGSWKVR